jgi:hypothetical protein
MNCLINSIILFKDNIFKIYNINTILNVYYVNEEIVFTYENGDLYLTTSKNKLKLLPTYIKTNTNLNENHSITFIFQDEDKFIIQKPNVNKELKVNIINNKPKIQNNGDMHKTNGNVLVSINTFHNTLEDVINNTYLKRLFTC